MARAGTSNHIGKSTVRNLLTWHDNYRQSPAQHDIGVGAYAMGNGQRIGKVHLRSEQTGWDGMFTDIDTDRIIWQVTVRSQRSHGLAVHEPCTPLGFYSKNHT